MTLRHHAEVMKNEVGAGGCPKTPVQESRASSPLANAHPRRREKIHAGGHKGRPYRRLGLSAESGRAPTLKILLVAALLLFTPAALHAVRLEISHGAIVKTLKKEVFNQKYNRKYLTENPDDNCYYAFVENPAVSRAGNRLRIRAQFHGNLGKEVFGRCVGLGNSFDVTFTGKPVQNPPGVMRLSEVTVSTTSDVMNTVFQSMLESFAASLENDLRFDVKERLMEITKELQKQSGLTFQITKATVSSITLTDTSVMLDLQIEGKID